VTKEFVNWEAGAIVTKAYQDEKGKMHVIAVASDDGIDLQKDQMTTDALDKMAEQALKGVPLLESHRSTFEFGKSVHGTVGTAKDENGKVVKQLVVDVELDGEFPQSRKLFKEIQGGGCARQLSIGGKLNLKNKSAISIEMTNKGLVRKIHDLDLDHIACTRQNQAANPRTSFVEAVMKSIEDGGGLEGISVTDVRKQDEEENGDEKVTTPGNNEGDQTGETPETTESGTPETESTGSINPEDFAQDAARGAGILAAVGRLFKKSLTGGSTMDPGKKEEKDVSNIKKVGEVVGAVSPDAAKPGVKDEVTTTKESCKKTWPGMDSTSGSSDSSSGSDSKSDTTTSETKESSSGSTTTTDSSDSSGSGSGSETSDKSSGSTGSGHDTTIKMTSVSKDEAFAGAAPPFKAEDAKEEDSTPEEEEAAKVLMRRRLVKAEDAKAENAEEETPAEDEEQMVREIAILLSKAQRENLLSKSPKDQVTAEAVKGALWNIRYLLAKQVVEGGQAGDSAGAVAALIVDGGLYAPTTESAGQAAMADDKASGDAAVAPVAVTDHRNLPPVGGEIPVTAPTVGQSMAAVKSAQAAAGTLPQVPDAAGFSKSLQDETLNKSMEAASTLILKATETVVKASDEKFEVISKALESFDKRLASIEKVGVSQSGPRGTSDAVVEKSAGSSRGAWGGIFAPAAKQATQRM